MQGLALPALAKEGGTPAFFRMVEAGMLDAPMFALWLSPDPVAEPAGEVHFGGHDRRRYNGVMHELPVMSTKFWTVAVTGVNVGERRLQVLGAEGAILDSGTSMIMASDADAAAINQVRSCGETGAMVSCSLLCTGRPPSMCMVQVPFCRGTAMSQHPRNALRGIVHTGLSPTTAGLKEWPCWAQAIPGMQWEAGAGAWRLVSGCAAVDSLPDITLELGGFGFVLTPRQYIIMVRTSLSRMSRTCPVANVVDHACESARVAVGRTEPGSPPQIGFFVGWAHSQRAPHESW